MHSPENKFARRLFAAMAVLAVCVVRADVTWDDGGDGNWASADRWGGALPTDADKVVLPPCSTDYTVTFNSETDNVIGGLAISTGDNLATTTATVLRVEKPLTIKPASQINIYRCGQIVISDGGSLIVDSASTMKNIPAMFLNYRGSLLHVDGGTFEMLNYGYFYVCNGWSSNITMQRPEVRISSGDFRIVHTNTADTGLLYYCYANNFLNMTGGRLVLVGHSADQPGYKQLSDNTSLNLSGDAAILTTNVSFQIGRGGAVIGGNARIKTHGGGRFYVGTTDSSDRSASLTLKENSSMDLYATQFAQFGSGNSEKTCTVTVSYEGGNHTNALWNVWGCGRGTTTVNVTGGFSVINRFGLVVAAPWFYAAGAGQSTTGTVNVSGGVLSVTAEQNKWTEALGRLSGFIIGCGAVANASGYIFDGRLNVSGTGIVTNGAPFVVGAGLAEGTVTQTGGEIYSYATYAPNASAGNPVAIGMCGAKGTYSVSGGTSTFFAPVWVGGMVTNHLHRRPFNIPAGSNGARTSTGRLAVSGGTFHAKCDMYVGCDGTGTIDVSGGELRIDGNLVLSNAVKSVLNVSLADGTASPAITVGGSLVATDAAEIAVDGTAIDAGSQEARVFLSCASATGVDPAAMAVTGRGSVRMRRTSGGGVAFAYVVPRGTVLTIR